MRVADELICQAILAQQLVSGGQINGASVFFPVFGEARLQPFLRCRGIVAGDDAGARQHIDGVYPYPLVAQARAFAVRQLRQIGFAVFDHVGGHCQTTLFRFQQEVQRIH